LERSKTPGVPACEAKRETRSHQEKRVRNPCAEGRTNGQIDLDLGLSDRTVKSYLSNILEKPQLTRRSQAVAFFVRFSHE
jgi:DNA-binding NarL/FixJ family response regulator